MPQSSHLTALAIALLRIALGVMFFTHGFILKYWTYGFDGTAQFFGVLGFPPVLAYATIIAETVGGLMLIAGIMVRLVCLALLPVLLGALWVHSGNGWVFDSPHGGWEFPLYLVVLCIAQALLGAGAFALVRPGRSLNSALSRGGDGG